MPKNNTLMRIISPLATGNGAHVIHKALEHALPNYHVASYPPWLTLCPPALKAIGLSRRGINLVHTTPDYAIWSKRKNTPLIITFHNYVLDPYMTTYSSKLQALHYKTDLRWLTRKATHKADILTAVSRFTANLSKQDLNIEKEIRVIHNGIDETLFTPANNHGNTRKIKVLFSGNPTTRKGAHWLLPIAEKLNDRIEISYTQGLRSGDKLNDHPRLRCIGNVPYDQMPDLYKQYDILLLPTVREGLPLAVLEAMASGLPVIATNCSSLPELIDHDKGGYLCPLGNIDVFAERINTLADSAELRREMGQYNRAIIEERFTLDEMVAQYRALFEQLTTS